MRWESLFADLQAQLNAADATALDAEIAERVRIETGAVTLADRLRGHLASTPDMTLVMGLRGGTLVRGTVSGVGADIVWLAEETRSQVLLPLESLVTVGGLGRPSRTEPSPVARRLGLRHALRGLSRERQPVRVVTVTGLIEGTIDRVGADHVDVVDRRPGEIGSPGGSFAVPLPAVVAVRPG